MNNSWGTFLWSIFSQNISLSNVDVARKYLNIEHATAAIYLLKILIQKYYQTNFLMTQIPDAQGIFPDFGQQREGHLKKILFRNFWIASSVSPLSRSIFHLKIGAWTRMQIARAGRCFVNNQKENKFK